MAKKRAVISGRSILSLDVLGEVRRAQRYLRRVEKFLVQEERRAKRSGKGGAPLARVALTPRGEALLGRALVELGGQG